MSRICSILVLTAIVFTLLAPAASAQAGNLFSLQVSQQGSVSDLPASGTVLMEAPGIGQQTTAAITVTYNGRLTGEGFQNTTINAVQLTGSLDFQISNPGAPFAMERGDKFTINVRYTPSMSDLQAGLISISYRGEDADLTLEINLNGAAPEFAYTYTPAGGNETQVTPGTALEFPESIVGNASSGAFKLINRGAAAGSAENVSVTGEGFSVTGLPLLPVEVEPEGSLSFTVTFEPTQLGAAAGQLAVQLAGGSATFPLEGSGTGVQFSYELTIGDQTSPIESGDVVRLPDTLVNETAPAIIRVRNTGNTDGVLSAITASGAAYAVDDLPFLPATLKPQGSILFTLNFTPSDIGQQVGRLLIGEDEFDLIGDGVGSFIEYTSTVGETTITVQDKGTVIFTPAAVGESTQATFTITNSGATGATINSISLGSTGSAFSLSGLPALPLVLEGGSAASFAIEFTPVVEGSATVSLVVDAATFTLSGTGTPPSPLPSYSFQGAGGIQEPASQPSLGVTLNEPYSLKVVGELKLAFASEVFADDPSVQFATGGRTVDFEIPAGSTDAIFPNGTNRIKVQTGTVAGTITLTPSFATSGGADLTPDPPPAQAMAVVESAPVITSAVISSKSLSAMTLQITGFSTARSVNQVSLQFTARPGETLGTSNLSISAGSQFGAWYASSQSKPFGSMFLLTVPLNFTGDASGVIGAANTVQSISITLSNSQGTSNSVTVNNADSL